MRLRNPMVTVTIYPGCQLTEDELEAVHDAAVAALPAHADPDVSSVTLKDGDDA